MGFVNNVNVDVRGAAHIAPCTYKTVVLKQNVTKENLNVLTQAMLDEWGRNTKFVIKWDYILTNNIIVPKNCLIEFDGGSVDGDGYTLIGNDTILIYNLDEDTVLKNVVFAGTFIRKTGGETDKKDNTDGMGKIILVNDKPFSEQLTQENTIYVIKYDFTLTEDITVPENCVLEFDGGSISGAYTITGQNTGINARLVKIFNTNITLTGTWNVVEAYPEWFGAFPFETLSNATSAINYVDLAECTPKLYCISRTVFLSDGFYKTLGTINVKNLRGNGKTSCIAAFASTDDYNVLTLGTGDSESERIWNMTIDSISIYLQPLSNNLKRTSCLTIKATTRCVVNNITCWNYINKPSEFTDEELDNIPSVCNYGIVFDGSTELFTLSNYVVSGDIGIYFKSGTDQATLSNGYIEGNSYSYCGIYGRSSQNFKIDGHLDIALGLCGIKINGTSWGAIMSMDNVRIEQLRSTSFSEHKNYALDFSGYMAGVIITNSYIPSWTNSIRTNVPLKLYGCSNNYPGSNYLGNEFINAANTIEFINCGLVSNGKIILSSGLECYGIRTPTTFGNNYTGISVKNGSVKKKVDESDERDSTIYDFKGEGIFVISERFKLASRYQNFLKYVPSLFKSFIKFFIIEIETVDGQYYQKTAIRYTYDTTTNKLVFKNILYNYGDNVFYPNGESPSGLISISGDGNGTLGALYFNSSLSRTIDFIMNCTCIAPDYDGNRN